MTTETAQWETILRDSLESISRRTSHWHQLVLPQSRLLCGAGDRDTPVERALGYGYYGA